MIIMKIVYTIPGKISLLEFVLFIKFVVSYIYMTFFSLFLRVQSAVEVGATSYETPCIVQVYRSHVRLRFGLKAHLHGVSALEPSRTRHGARVVDGVLLSLSFAGTCASSS